MGCGDLYVTWFETQPIVIACHMLFNYCSEVGPQYIHQSKTPRALRLFFYFSTSTLAVGSYSFRGALWYGMPCPHLEEGVW